MIVKSSTKFWPASLGLTKVTLHGLSAILVTQADAPARLRVGGYEALRACTRKGVNCTLD